MSSAVRPGQVHPRLRRATTIPSGCGPFTIKYKQHDRFITPDRAQISTSLVYVKGTDGHTRFREFSWAGIGRSRLAQTTGLPLRLQEGDDVVLTDGADDVADDGALGLQKFSTHLGDTTTGAGAAKAL